MLYNPKWDDPLTLERLIAWLETQDQTTVYEYQNTRDCLLCRYLNASGQRGVSVGSNLVWRNGEPKFLSDGLDRVATRRPHTYGSALERAREELRVA